MTNNLGKNAVILTASKIITLLITLVSAMLLARFRTLEEYGTYSQLLLAITLAVSLFSLGLPNSTNYFLARADSREERKQFLSVYYTANTIVSIVIGVALFCAMPLLTWYFGNDEIKLFWLFLILFPWTRVTIGSLSNVLVVYGKTGLLMLFNVINASVVLVTILFVQWMDWTFRDYMLLYLLGEMAMTIWVHIIVRNLEGSLRFSIDGSLMRKIFQYAIPIGLAGLVGTISIEIDKLMIGRFFDTEQLAIYTNASKELPLTIVASSLTAVLLPQMARMLKEGKNKEAVELWGYTIRLSYIIICFCVTALVVFAPQIITILYSEKYLPGVAVFRVYSVVLLLRCTYFGMILNSVGKTKLILYSSLASLALNAVLNYALYLVFGMVGSAIATFLSIAIVAVCQLYATSTAVNITFSRIFPWVQLLKITAINFLMGIVLYFFVFRFSITTSSHDILISIFIGFISLVVYFFITKKEILTLWRKINHVS